MRRLVRSETLWMFLAAGLVFSAVAYFNGFAMKSVILAFVLVPMCAGIGLGGDVRNLQSGKALLVSLLVAATAYGGVAIAVHTISPHAWPVNNLDYVLWPTMALLMVSMAMTIRHYARKPKPDAVAEDD